MEEDSFRRSTKEGWFERVSGNSVEVVAAQYEMGTVERLGIAWDLRQDEMNAFENIDDVDSCLRPRSAPMEVS